MMQSLDTKPSKTKNQKIILLFLLTFLIGGAGYLCNAGLHRSGQVFVETKTSTKVFNVEVADTWLTKTRGLMHRQNIPSDAGMYFLYDRPKSLTIWMKNTPLPLDVIFIDANAKIIKIHKNAQPYDLTPINSDMPAIAVLEILGGQSAKSGIRVGDLVRMPVPKTGNLSLREFYP